MSLQSPKNPDDRVLTAEEAGLTPEEEAGIRLALEESARGEGIPGDHVFEELHAELEALIRVHERRAG
jgi:hypothetical protein